MPASISEYPTLIDSHAHMDAACFDDDRHEVLAQARACGIRDVIVPATIRADWERLATICTEHPMLHPTVGLHPMFLDAHHPSHLDQLAAAATAHRVVAIGECGLDFYIDDPQPESQRFYFTRQLEIARDLHLPVIIHARRAVEEVILTLRKMKDLRGVVHSFAGSYEQARQLQDMGFYISVGGPLTYPRAKRLRRTIAAISLDMLMLETDAPDQPNQSHQGRRNEPKYMQEVLSVVAALREDDAHTIAHRTTCNAQQLFKLQA